MRVGVVISTLGKSTALSLVLDSLVTQSSPAKQVIVVDQSEGSTISDLVRTYEGLLPITRLTSALGAARGRNTGWRALTDCDVVAFPDDDCTYGTEVLAQISSLFEDVSIGAVSGRLTGVDQRLAFAETRSIIDRKSVWTKAIEATTFYRLTSIAGANGFDDSLGVGSDTIWQSGEGTDLLLRVLDLGWIAVYEPSIVVTEHQIEITPEAYLRKVRAYGRGTGRVYRLRYTPMERALVVTRPIAAAVACVLKGRPYDAQKKLNAAIGRLEGMRHPVR